MNFELLIKDIALWQFRTFPTQSCASKMNHLKKEINELKDALEGKIPGNWTIDPNASANGLALISHELIAEELADCMLLLIGIAAIEDIDIPIMLEWKHRINVKRKWGEPDADGVIEHIEEGTE